MDGNRRLKDQGNKLILTGLVHRGKETRKLRSGELDKKMDGRKVLIIITNFTRQAQAPKVTSNIPSFQSFI